MVIREDSGPVSAEQRLKEHGMNLNAWLLVGAGGLTACYPNFLQWWHTSYTAHGLSAAALTALFCVYFVPATGFYLALVLGRSSLLTVRTLLLRRLALLMVAVPPAFSLLGMMLLLMKINDADAAVWRGACLIIASGAILRYFTISPMASTAVTDDLVRLGRLRYSHGIVAAVLFSGFVAWHLLNHLVALESSTAHGAVMHVFRHFYRNPLIEPTLLVLIAFQILSGLTLWSPKTRAPADVWTTLQTASGIYLAVYLASHVNSIFVLARHFGIETDWDWAAGAPLGVLRDAWDIRLLPHYSLAVFMVLTHLSCGLRGILVAHQFPSARADRVTWLLIGFSAAVAFAITVALVGGRLP
jgi:hypothetical protein